MDLFVRLLPMNYVSLHGRVFSLALAVLAGLSSVRAEPNPTGADAPETGQTLQAVGLSPDTLPAVVLLISSDPPGAFITVDGNDSVYQTPVRLVLDRRVHALEAVASGYEPLSYEVRPDSADSVTLAFTLRELAPAPLAAESLGMAILPLQPIHDTTAPDRKMRSYMGAAEMFAVFPLMQGVLIRSVGDNSLYDVADLLIVSGAVLAVGSYITGKILSRRQHKSILAKNEEIALRNDAALLQNRDVERKVKLADRERKLRWETEAKRRGFVQEQRYP